ncbi:MAG: AI-2E family transporter [Microbacteriaceae bacterium]
MSLEESETGKSFFRRVLNREPSVEAAVPWGVKVAAAWSWRLLVIIGVLIVFGILIIELRYLVIPMLIALLLGALLVPVVDWLHRHRWKRWLAVLVVEIGIIAVVTGLVILVVTQVRAGFSDLQERTSLAIDELKVVLNGDPFYITNIQIDEYIHKIAEFFEKDVNIILNGLFSVGSTVGHVLTGLLLTLFALVFVLLDGRMIWNWIVRLLPKRARAAAHGGGKAAWVTLSSYIRVQIVVALIDAVGIGLGAFILGLPMAFPIMILVFMGSFIPIVGAVLTGTIAVFVALIYNGWLVAIIMLAVVLLVQQVEGHVLQPWIMGSAVKIHPLAIVLVVAGGTMVAGIPGALFAVPLVAMLNTGISYIANGHWRTNPNPTIEDVIAQ